MILKRSVILLAQALCLVLVPQIADAQGQPEAVWHYRANDGRMGWFEDVVWTGNHQEPGLALTGTVQTQRDRFGYNGSGFWLLCTDSEGREIINRSYRDEERAPFQATGHSIISCDDGGYLIGGRSNMLDTTNWRDDYGYFTMVKLDQGGEVEWFKYFGEEFQSADCRAVIELKNGNFVGIGYSRLEGTVQSYAVMTNPAGEVIWENGYVNYTVFLEAIRETEDGLVIAGWGRNAARLFKVDFDGEVVWAVDPWPGSFRDMKSCPDGGFVLVGNRHDSVTGQDIRLVRVDDDGAEIWTRVIAMTDEPDYGKSIVVMPDGGFLSVGYAVGQGQLVRLNRGGNLMWSAQHEVIDEYHVAHLYSITLDGQNRPIVVGEAGGGIMFRLQGGAEAPQITEYSPATSEFFLLAGDAKAFSVTATDPQEDELSYSWMLNGEVVGEGAETEITFPDIADYAVKCTVSDGENETDVEWTVRAVELYIEGWSPEPFQFGLRKNVEVEFDLTVRALESEDELQYRWLVDGVETGIEAGLTHSFATNGVHSVEGAVYRGDEWRASDAIAWNVTVTSLINSATPDMDSLTVYRDEAVIFHAFPLDSALEITYSWRLNDRRAAGNVDSLEVTFDADGVQTLTVSASHEVETDRHSWVITVLPPNDAGAISHQPSAFSLSAPSPNPFNSKTVASFQLPVSSVVKLGVYDLSGRLVKELVTGTEAYAPGRHSVTWDAAGVPAGTYVVKLEASGNVETANVTLIK